MASASGQLVEVQYVGIAAHEGALRNAILNLKYRHQRAVSKQLALVVVDALRNNKFEIDDCVITWAPTTTKRIRQRGFDHSELIARHVGAYLHAPVRRLLRRTNDRPQTGHSRTDRLNAVTFVGRSLRYKSVLLVDDVTTTGATFRAAATELVRCGARRVICVAPSRTR